jgi:hypothetical protein
LIHLSAAAESSVKTDEKMMFGFSVEFLLKGGNFGDIAILSSGII